MKEDLYRFPFEPMRFPFNLEVLGYTIDDADSSHVETRENCYMYLCEYIVKGSGYLICNEQEYTPEAGDFYILHKGSNHTYYPNPEDPWEKIWFVCDGPLIPNLLQGFSLQKNVFFKNFYNENLFQELLDMAKRETISDLEELNYEFGMKFIDLMYLLNRHKTTRDLIDVSEKIQEILDANIYKTLNLDLVSEKVFLSKAHIINIFQKKFGITPYQYFLKKKISLATLYLIDSSYSINEISQLLSFSNYQYFCRIFKKTTGVTPLQYRKTHNKQSGVWLRNDIPMTLTDSGWEPTR